MSLATQSNLHSTPAHIERALRASKQARATWDSVTPLARNEWICWITSAKLADTRQRRLRIAIQKLSKGERRPCCWAGCPHRSKNN